MVKGEKAALRAGGRESARNTPSQHLSLRSGGRRSLPPPSTTRFARVGKDRSLPQCASRIGGGEVSLRTRSLRVASLLADQAAVEGHGAAPLFVHQQGVDLDLFDLGEVDGHLAEAQHHVDDGIDIGRGRAAEPGEQPARARRGGPQK